ncbi:hypothetical protein GGR53DRAFT_494481 [Hypoxylon sp. FL1150]|nr:hypothetical protein GGR53DRAFT_494481 [Hypoxylon sp. FL1150]
MTYREKPEACEGKFRKKLKFGLLWCSILFLAAGAMLVIEVFCLLALQYCDGEDLMSLLWSTWTMLQLGSEIAILGIVLALWHHLYDIKHPYGFSLPSYKVDYLLANIEFLSLWALALGTPVLVVAGFGHVMHLALRVFYKRAKAKRRARKSSSSTAAPSVNVTLSSSSCSIKPAREQTEPHEICEQPSPGALEAGRPMYFALDVGDDERVKRWPSFVGLTSSGKSVVQLTAYPGVFSDDNETI